MKCKWIGWAGLAAAGVLLIVPAVNAPKPGRDEATTPATIDEAIAAVKSSGLRGWSAVDYATRLVNARFTHYSIWHTWESPRLAYRHRRGYSNQYNGALAQILQSLGFDVEIVHAARVRAVRNPWFHAGHTWLRVTVDGSTRDVCAGNAANTSGRVHFVPQTPVRTAHVWSPHVMAFALVPFTVVPIWRHLVGNRPIPAWIYRPM